MAVWARDRTIKYWHTSPPTIKEKDLMKVIQICCGYTALWWLRGSTSPVYTCIGNIQFQIFGHEHRLYKSVHLPSHHPKGLKNHFYLLLVNLLLIFPETTWILTKYSGFQAKWCKLFLALARLLTHSGCYNACDINVWSHTHDILPIEAF